MKNILYIIIITFLCFTKANATEKFVPEVVAGVNISGTDLSESGYRIGFHAGIRADYYIKTANRGWYFNGGALFTLKGFRILDHSVNPFYLEIPIHLGYRFSIKNKVTFYGDFGPYVGIGLFGSRKGKNVFGENECRRIDAGFGFRLGATITPKYTLTLGYDFGAKNLYNDISLKSRNYTISLGYKF